ncbi:uncharacterized protein [Asterias amurensis]|uniref:uncharacterized protein n=1 Tax=Asterias amurensis TaxID=7602 RepID=UPI003AB1D09D
MNYSVFIFVLFATCFTTTTTLTIDVTSDIVTVREGEKLNLSCSITLDGQGIREFRWYRGSDPAPYGSIDVTNCSISSLCPEVNTTDNRGVLHYRRGFLSEATLTLVINRTLTRDNTSFYCGLFTLSNTFPRSDNIHVIIQHLPDPSYPMCLRSNSSTNADILSFSCWAELTQPVVSLEWTVEGSSAERISLSHQTEIYEDRVENTLFLNEPGIPSGSLVFICHMTSSAFPHTRMNCSIRPILIPGEQTTAVILPSPEQTTAGILPDPTTATTSPRNDLASTNPTTTPFARDGTPATPTDLPPLSHAVVIAAATSAFFGFTTIILLLIIAYLVSSKKRRFNDTEPRVDLPLTTVASCATHISDQGTGPMYQNTRQPHPYENSLTPNIHHQDGDKSTGERPSTVDAMPTYYEPVLAGGGSTQQAGAQRQPGGRVKDTSAVNTGDAESGYQALEMTNQPLTEYTKLDLAPRDG